MPSWLDAARRMVAITAVVASAVSSSSVDAAPRRRVVDGIVAIVDATCITRSELARHFAPHEAKIARELADHPVERLRAIDALRKEALRDLIDRRLFDAEARRRGIVVTDDEVATVLAALAKENGISIPELMAAAKAEGLDDARYRAELRAQILDGKLVQHALADTRRDWSGMTEDQRTMQIAMVREALAAKLRERAFIETRL